MAAGEGRGRPSTDVVPAPARSSLARPAPTSAPSARPSVTSPRGCAHDASRPTAPPPARRSRSPSLRRPDLDEVARLTGLTPSEVVAAHTGIAVARRLRRLRPGLRLPRRWRPAAAVPRRDHPRTSVPAGAVGLAASSPAIYPRPSPGRLAADRHDRPHPLGRRPRPAGAAHPGTTVRFVDVGGSTVSPSLEVLATGPLVLVQDEGRPGLAAVGVGRSGAADRTAHRLGARLVGHPADRAALEVLLGGLTVRARGRLTVALTGARRRPPSTGVRRARRPRRPRRRCRCCPWGCRPPACAPTSPCGGGSTSPPVLGSRITDTLSGVGPPPMAVGPRLPVGDPGGALPPRRPGCPPAVTAAGRAVLLDVLPGPVDWVGGWTTRPRRPPVRGVDVSGQSDRVGRLTRAASSGRPGRTPSCPARASFAARSRCRRAASRSSSSPTTP